MFVVTFVPALASGLAAWWAKAPIWDRFLIGMVAWILILNTLWFALWAVKRFGSRAEVKFVFDRFEARLYVTNHGPAARFFASLWFEGQGTGGHHRLFGNWGDATEHRIPLAQGETGMLILGQIKERDNGLRTWAFPAVTHHNHIEPVNTLTFWKPDDPVSDSPHARVRVQVFADPDLEIPVPDQRVNFFEGMAALETKR